jgi:hypothetical protein
MYEVERWTGKAWGPVMLSPFKNYTDVSKYLKKYWWHFTKENPYRVKDSKPVKVQKYKSKYNPKDWNSDTGMTIINKVMY